MAIPELMFGTWRYQACGYSGEYFTHHNTQATKAALMSTTFAAIEIRHPACSIVSSLLLIIFGLLAIVFPLATSFGIVLVIGWLLILSSAFLVLHACQSQGAGRNVWKSVVALLYLGVGIYFLAQPLLGFASLTLALGFCFATKAILDLFAYLRARTFADSGWLLLDGVGTLSLGLLIWRQWPFSSSWAIGILVGISMLLTGTSCLMIRLTGSNMPRRTSRKGKLLSQLSASSIETL
jgi:uncharacterized membrane protein HdeD (DUF308 family)